jgi:hypothetical protein
MPTPIKIKNSVTPGAVPTTGDLIVAELAVNLADGQLYTRDDQNNIRPLGGRVDIYGNIIFDESVTINGDLIINAGIIIRPVVTTDTTTARTITAADENVILLFTNAGAITVTVPEDATEDLPIGFLCHLYQMGAGQVTIAEDGIATANASIGLKTRTQYSSLTIVKVAADTYNIVGDMSA